MKRIIDALILCLLALNSYAWNANGHKIIAQIAFDNLSPDAKRVCSKYIRTSDSESLNGAFLATSVWMDKIKSKNMHQYDLMHYIDIPFSIDETPTFPVASMNAVSAINEALAIFSSNKAKPKNKLLALRILIHVVGDIHQPLHAITRVSAKLPQGDLGGNLFPLGKNSIGSNLHQYWDNGAGYFHGHFNTKQIQNRAWQLEQKWPCERVNTKISPAQWAKRSNQIAKNYAYHLNPDDIPDEKYKKQAQILVKKQAAFAGCRLASLLNNVLVN